MDFDSLTGFRNLSAAGSAQVAASVAAAINIYGTQPRSVSLLALGDRIRGIHHPIGIGRQTGPLITNAAAP